MTKTTDSDLLAYMATDVYDLASDIKEYSKAFDNPMMRSTLWTLYVRALNIAGSDWCGECNSEYELPNGHSPQGLCERCEEKAQREAAEYNRMVDHYWFNRR